MHKCRDCASLISTRGVILCPRCRASAAEKRKAQKREKAQATYHAKQQIKRTPEQSPPYIKPPHPCATKDCGLIIEGNAVYCPSCRYTRQLRHQKNYRNNVISSSDDLTPEPPTSLKWLDKFSTWSQSGMSYAKYQSMGMEKSSKLSS